MRNSTNHKGTDLSETSERNIDERLLHEVGILYDLLPMSQWIHLIGATVLFGVLYQYIDSSTLERWVGFFLFVICLRIIITDRYRKADKTPQNAQLWFNLFLIGTALYGVMWSGSAIYLVPNDSTTTTGITGLLLCSLAAGSVAISSVNIKVFVVYAISTLWPYSALLIVSNQMPQALYGWFIISFSVVITLLAVRVNIYFSNLIKLRQKTIFLEQEVRMENHKRKMIENALLDNTLEEELSELIRHHAVKTPNKETLTHTDNKLELPRISPGALNKYLHELNSVVTNQVNSVEDLVVMLKGTSLTKDQDKYLSIIRKILHDIVTSIKKLDFEEFEEDVTDPKEVKKINIHQLLIHLSDEIPILYKSKYITIKRHITDDLGCDIFGKPDSLKRTLRILIDNSFQNMDGGIIEINVNLESESEDTKVIRFEITDTGSGMPQDILDEYLSKDDPEPDDKSGLTRVKKYALRHGGHTFGKSALGIGTSIGFCLPFFNQKFLSDSDTNNNEDKYRFRYVDKPGNNPVTSHTQQEY